MKGLLVSNAALCSLCCNILLFVLDAQKLSVPHQLAAQTKFLSLCKGLFMCKTFHKKGSCLYYASLQIMPRLYLKMIADGLL